MIERIGKYLIRRELGRGGMGIVYLAVDETLNREVAVKIIRPGFHIGERAVERFKREARAAAALSHPHVAHINALQEIDDQLVIEMPFLAGGSLKHRVQRGMSIGQLCRVLDQVLQALECCHAVGIVHRDVKPSNILFDDLDQAKLSDFGAATLAAEELNASVIGDATTFIGTPRYACPEAWEEGPPTPAWDLYSVGVVLWEAIAGELPNANRSPLAFLRGLYETRLPAIRETVPELSIELAELIDDLCAHDAYERPASAAEARERLAAAPESEGLSGDRDQTAVLRTRKRNRPWSQYRDQLTRTIKRGRRYTVPVMTSFVLGAIFAVWWGFGSAAPVGEASPSARANREAQPEVLATSIPSTDALLDTFREIPGFRTEVYELIALDEGESPNEMLLARHENGDRLALATLRGDVLLLRISESPVGAAVEGVWGNYRGGMRKGLVLGTVRGTQTLEDETGLLLRMELRLRNDTTGDEWNETILAKQARSGLTDTAVLYAWEQDATVFPVLTREILPRHPDYAATFRPLLTSLQDGALDGLRLSSNESIERDGVLSERAWTIADSVDAIPAVSNAWMRVTATTAGIVIGLSHPRNAKSDVREIDLRLLPGYDVPRQRSPYLEASVVQGEIDAHWIVAGERRSVSEFVEAYSSAAAGEIQHEIFVAYEAIERERPPYPLESFRVSARMVSEGDEDAAVVWGWPSYAPVEHGILVTFRDEPTGTGTD